MTGHTPGPWVATSTPDLFTFVCLDDESHTIIASISTTGTADTHLIAAAPELLDVARRLEIALKNLCGDHQGQLMVDLRRAIAKAGGTS